MYATVVDVAWGSHASMYSNLMINIYLYVKSARTSGK